MSQPNRSTPSGRSSGGGKPATSSRPSSSGPPQQQQPSAATVAASATTGSPSATAPPPPVPQVNAPGSPPRLNNNSNSNSNNNAVAGGTAQPPTAAATHSGTTAAAPPASGSAIIPPPVPSSQHQPPAAAASHDANSGGTAAPQQSGNSSTAPPSTTAAAVSATAASAPPTTAAPGARVRPVMQLTQNLVQQYHETNERIFHRRRWTELPGPRFNDGYDDSHGHYIVFPGEEIIGRYAVIDTLGRGSFGTVVRAYDTRRKEMVAVKITRSGTGFRNQAKLEIDILMKILTQAPDSKTVRILKAFDWKGHLVIVFELLSFNLYQLMQCTNYHGVSLDLTSKFAFQLLMVLRDLERLNPPVLHCDLKPENVLLVNQNRSAIRVIDFGSACYLNRRMFRYIQSRYYRSPEVILGLEYGTAIDRWSLGCILVELHTGVALFDGRNEAQQLQRFEGLLGPLPHSMIAQATKRDNFYDTVTDEEGNVTYRLKLPPEPQHIRTLPQVLERTQRRRHTQTTVSSSSTSAATGGAAGSTSTATTAAASGGATGGDAAGGSQQTDTQERYEQFMDLVKKLLEYDPAKRIGVLPAMEHPFLCEFMPYYLQRTANQQQQQQAAATTTATSSGATTTTTTASGGAATTAAAGTTTTGANPSASTANLPQVTAPPVPAAAAAPGP